MQQVALPTLTKRKMESLYGRKSFYMGEDSQSKYEHKTSTERTWEIVSLLRFFFKEVYWYFKRRKGFFYFNCSAYLFLLINLTDISKLITHFATDERSEISYFVFLYFKLQTIFPLTVVSMSIKVHQLTGKSFLNKWFVFSTPLSYCLVF